jgi:hypothetical protein
MTSPLDRRDFVRQLAAGAAATIPLVAAQTTAADPPDPVAEKLAANAPKTPLDLVVELIRQSDPDRLKPEHLEELRKKVAYLQARSQLLSRFPLTNADEPAFVFSAYR